MDAVDRGVRLRPAMPGVMYHAYVDMSGGSSDDAVLGIAHLEPNGRVVLDRVLNQGHRSIPAAQFSDSSRAAIVSLPLGRGRRVRGSHVPKRLSEHGDPLRSGAAEHE